MGTTKTDVFTKKEMQIARYAKALGHPARILILQYLLKTHTCICGDIVEQLPLSQSTVSQHLKELKESGLIQGNIEGAKVCYCINQKEWESAGEALEKLFRSFQSNQCC